MAMVEWGFVHSDENCDRSRCLAARSIRAREVFVGLQDIESDCRLMHELTWNLKEYFNYQWVCRIAQLRCRYLSITLYFTLSHYLKTCSLVCDSHDVLILSIKQRNVNERKNNKVKRLDLLSCAHRSQWSGEALLLFNYNCHSNFN